MTTKSLLLIWRDANSKLYFHVGTLTYDGHVYTFEYTFRSKATRRVHDAIEHGYTLHPAFPNLNKTYVADKLFSAFARRIPSSNRLDYNEVLKKLSLPAHADQMDILRATRGMTGRNPYIFDEPLRLTSDNVLKNKFYISGMRYSELPENWSSMIQKGDELVLKPDVNNAYDANVVKILTQNKLVLGYVPAVFAKAIRALLDREAEMNVVVNEINSNYSPQWWIQIDFQSVLEKNHIAKDIVELEGLFTDAA